MTERLKELLAGEADQLDVPAPPTDSVLHEGRGIRRRNRLVTGAVGLAAAVVVGGSVVALAGGGGNDAAPDPAGQPISGNPVFSYGNHVFYDGPSHEAEIQDTAVKSLYYTSAGVLVRHGDNSASDGGGPQRFSLITPDGSVKRLGLVTEETVHASDVDQPYVAYAEAVDGELEVVVYDVVADAEEARMPVGSTSETWFPVAIDGDTVFVGDGSTTHEVDWRSGDVTDVDATLQSPLDIKGGRAPGGDRQHPTIVDVATGETLLELPAGGYPALSPDGHYAYLTDLEEAGGEFVVYDIDGGGQQTFPGGSGDWGWTADGDLFTVGKTDVRTCDSATGECTVEPYAQPNVPKPDPVTHTMSDPVCPDGGLECHTDPDFFEQCAENPDQCEWRETTYVDRPTIDLKLGGRTYES
jgi:hypothetical protein